MNYNLYYVKLIFSTYILLFVFLYPINIIYMSLLTIFRVIAFLEGLSYILLLFVAVPIKYMNNDPSYVKMLGMPHGMLFMGYIALSIVLRADNQWIKNNFFAVILASVIPFGTFVVEYKLNKFNKS